MTPEAALWRALLGPVFTIMVATGVFWWDSFLWAERETEMRLATNQATGMVTAIEDGRVVVEYHHRGVAAKVRSRRIETSRRYPLAVGDTIQLGYLPDDPYHIVDLGRPTPTSNTPNLLLWIGAGVAVACLVAYQYSAWALRKLAVSTGARFRMLGVVRSTRRSTMQNLDLFPLDAKAGDPALCTVPLADGGLRVAGGDAFELDVLGLPRPGGRVIGIVGRRWLWPKNRALLSRGGRRPEGVRRHVTVGRETSRSAGVGVMALAAGALLAWASWQTYRNYHGEQEVSARADAVVVEVLADADYEPVPVRIVSGPPGVVGLERTVPAGSSGYKVGQRYPAWSADGGDFLRLAKEPYDLFDVTITVLLPLVAVIWLGARSLYGRVASRRAATAVAPLT